MTESTKPLAFVLMPFSEEFTDVWTQLIKVPLEEVGFEVRRADSLVDQQNILRTIVRGIADAELVVADVTGMNENVLYELGIAHALGKRCVMITQDIEGLPFDLRPYRANKYSTHFTEAKELAVLMRRVGEGVIDGTAEFGTPVTDFAPEMVVSGAQVGARGGGRVGSGERGGHERSSGRSPASDSVTEGGGAQDNDTGGNVSGAEAGVGENSDEDEDPLGSLEIQVALEQCNSDLLASTELITTLTGALSSKIEGHTERFDDLGARFGDQAPGPLLAEARIAAEDYNEYSRNLQVARAKLADALSRYVDLTDQAAQLVTIESMDDANDVEELASTLDEYAQTLSDSHESTMGFAQSLLSMPRISRDLSRAANRTAKEVAETASILQSAHAEVSRIANVLRQRVESFSRDPLS